MCLLLFRHDIHPYAYSWRTALHRAVSPATNLVYSTHFLSDVIVAHYASTDTSSGANVPSFNPTPTPHWRYLRQTALGLGLSEDVVLEPGVPALHTVDEAIMCRELVERECERSTPLTVLVITSDFHVARAGHLFNSAFGLCLAAPGMGMVQSIDNVSVQLTGTSDCMDEPLLSARQRHETKALEVLRTAPFGVWLDFLKEQGAVRS